MLRLSITLTAALLFAAPVAGAQTATSYPSPPRGLPEADEIALAQSAAPAEVSSLADVYVLRGTEYVKVRSGTNGCACILVRDYHEGSRYPICFDREGTRTLLPRYVMEGNLRAQGVPDAEIDRRTADALARGTLVAPSRPLLAYMMSPRQVLFSSPDSAGRRVGAWYPHIMMSGVGITAEQAGLPRGYRWVQAGGRAGTLHEFVVLVPVWSDGSPAPQPQTAGR